MTENNINMTEIINEEAEVLRVEAVQAVPEAVPAQTVKKVSKTKGHGGRSGTGAKKVAFSRKLGLFRHRTL